MPQNLVLFDIDGTLVFKQSVHVDAFLHVFQEVYGITKSDFHWTGHHGKTDLWIIEEELSKRGIPLSEINARIPTCVNEMVKYERKHIKEDTGFVLPYVPEFLTELKKRGFLLGLVTGNLEGIASIKMRHFGLNPFFQDHIGGFGSEHRDRSELIKIALAKAEKYHKFKFSGTNVVYIGDTPLDTIAARKAGVPNCIVLTGVYTRKDFSDEQPDLFLDDFGQMGVFFKFYTNLQK